MRRVSFFMIILAVALVFAATATAAPSADMTATLSDVREDENGLLFTLSIQMSAPSEPYASMDFYLVCSDHERLAIVDKSAAGDRSSLDIVFTKDYGNAHHKGRIDSATGAISYLMGIYSKMGGNAITGKTDVCSVTLRYTGDEPQTLTLEKLKLVYKDASSKITSATGFASINIPIDPDVLADVADGVYVVDADVPLADIGDMGLMGAAGDDNYAVIIALAAVTVVLIGAIVTLMLRNRRYRLKLMAQASDTVQTSRTGN